uniref:Fibronectin type III-like domain-containing protein n=1 Tax=Ananas comosus var. bracteatus TaxID=296719 RepID=A0A6V7PG75_ANACO|nr:unnamed protein product [Ananas comosus var. bracteatus]
MSSKPFSLLLLLLLLLSTAILLRCAAGQAQLRRRSAGRSHARQGGRGGDAVLRRVGAGAGARAGPGGAADAGGEGAAARRRRGGRAAAGIAKYEWWSEALHGVANTGPGSASAAPSPAPPASPRSSPPPPPSTPPSGSSSARSCRMRHVRWTRGGAAARRPRRGPPRCCAVRSRVRARPPAALRRFPRAQPAQARRLLQALHRLRPRQLEGPQSLPVQRHSEQARFGGHIQCAVQACVEEGQVASVMCSYNQINGVPSCADPNLLSGTVRGLWGLDGCFIRCSTFHPHPRRCSGCYAQSRIGSGLWAFLEQARGKRGAAGKISDANIDAALIHTVMVQMRLGMFDGEPSKQPFGNLGPRDVCTQAHQDLALQAARQGIVLLDNDRGILPLSRDRVWTVAVVGPNSDATLTMIGNYAGNPCRFTSPLQGIGRYVNTIHQKGCTNVACVGNQPIEAAAGAARVADATIMIVGLDQSAETEALDRVSLLLPGRQQELVSKVAAAARGPVVLVLMCGGPVDVTFAKNDPKIGAILWAGYPGQAGGAAIADVIFGAYNPTPSDVVPRRVRGYGSYDRYGDATRPGPGYPGRSYRFYTGPVVYPFGHGLSYTRFAQSLAEPPPALLAVPVRGRPRLNSTGPGWAAVRVDRARCEGLVIPVHVDVANVGGRDGAHTVLVYSRPPPRGGSAPGKQLVAFEKVHVAAGGRVRVEVGVDVCRDMSFADVSGVRRIPIGDHSIQIGDLLHSVSLTVQAHV